MTKIGLKEAVDLYLNDDKYEVKRGFHIIEGDMDMPLPPLKENQRAIIVVFEKKDNATA